MKDATVLDIVAQASAILLDMAPIKNVRGSRDLRLVTDLGFDSLTLLEVIVALDDELGLKVLGGSPPASIETVGDVEDYLGRFIREGIPNA